MSYGLLKRILSHCKDEGWEGIIVDPFGGIGSTGILGAYEGYQVICVELERKFVDLARQNFVLHYKAWTEFGNPWPIIIQGDSRGLCEIVESAVDIIVSSPPFIESLQSNDPEFHAKWCKQHGRDVTKPNYKGKIDGYGQTPGQLGSMKPGKVDLILSSPPYAETPVGGNDVEATHKRLKKLAAEGKVGPRSISYAKSGKYAKSGNLALPSYGQTEGNLGNLKAGDVDCKSKRGFLDAPEPDTFWQAAKEIVQQCYQILKPGGHAIWVCKDFVRKGKRVPFSDDWQKLCESVGFKTLHRHKAMLVKEESHKSLFGHDIVKKTERKSFFRRLAEAKGSPKIDWEDVICMIRS